MGKLVIRVPGHDREGDPNELLLVSVGGPDFNGLICWPGAGYRSRRVIQQAEADNADNDDCIFIWGGDQ